MGKFVITTRKNGEFQFNLLAGNGQVILSSEGYSSKSSCIQGINSVKNNSKSESSFEKRQSANGKHYFVMKASNGQIIGNSQMYESEASMLKGIRSVMSNAALATLEEN